MPNIDESEVQKLRAEIKRLEKRLNERNDQSEKESVWAIPSEKRGRFYAILSICGIVVFIITILAKWCGWFWDTILEIFNGTGTGIFNSVVIVWFSFQAREVFMGWRDAVREGIREKGRQEGRQEERKRQSRFEKELMNQGVSEDKIRNARKFSDSSSKDR